MQKILNLSTHCNGTTELTHKQHGIEIGTEPYHLESNPRITYCTGVQYVTLQQIHNVSNVSV